MIFVLYLVFLALAYGDLCRCVFNKGVPESSMLSALNYVCGNADCSPIADGGYAFYPDTIYDHASWAINMWFQGHRQRPFESCNFGKTANVNCDNCTCLFKANATEQEMKDAMGFVCGNSNCSAIQPGGEHFEPDTIANHASWAIQMWYKKVQWTFEACQFFDATYLEPASCNPQQ